MINDSDIMKQTTATHNAIVKLSPLSSTHFSFTNKITLKMYTSATDN